MSLRRVRITNGELFCLPYLRRLVPTFYDRTIPSSTLTTPQDFDLTSLPLMSYPPLEEGLELLTPVSEPNNFRRYLSNGSPTPYMRRMKTESPTDNALGIFAVTDEQTPQLRLPDLFLPQPQPTSAPQTQQPGSLLFHPSYTISANILNSPVSPSSLCVDASGQLPRLPENLPSVFTLPHKATPTPVPSTPPNYQYPSPASTPLPTRPLSPSPACQIDHLQHQHHFQASSGRAGRAAARAAATKGTRSKRIAARSKPYGRLQSPVPRTRKITAEPDLEYKQEEDREGREIVQVCDEFKFGLEVRVYDVGSNSYRKKWRCRKCSATVGRKPDLHRHYKSCVNEEKHFCRDVTSEPHLLTYINWEW